MAFGDFKMNTFKVRDQVDKLDNLLDEFFEVLNNNWLKDIPIKDNENYTDLREYLDNLLDELTGVYRRLEEQSHPERHYYANKK